MLTSLGSINTINKFVKVGLPPLATIQSITSFNAPGPFNPLTYLTTSNLTNIVYSSNSIIIGCTYTLSNQTSPYTFCNGTYVLSSSCATNQVSNGGTLYYAFSGDSSADILQSPATYTGTGAYTGNVQTVVDGVTIYGEWMQIKLPYKLYVTTYNILTNAAGGGPSWNQMFPKDFTFAGSLDGITWNKIDSRTNYSATSGTGINHFTAPTQTNGYTYFRLIGQALSSSNTFKRMGVALGIQGDYKNR